MEHVALQRLRLYARLTRQDKPIGTLLLLWPTLTALWLAAQGTPETAWVIVFALGTWLMRSAGCAFNDVADRKFDAHVKRTAQRVLATGELKVAEALVVGLVLLGMAASLLWWLNPLSVWLAAVAAGVAVSYPLFKRFFPMPQAYLGVAFSFGILMAYATVLGYVALQGWVFFAANLFWVVAYDTEYAMVDRDDDLKLGLRSSAVWLGHADVAVVMLCYAIFLGAMAWVGHTAKLGPVYFLGWGVALLCALYHYRLIRTRQREACLRAFLHNQWLGFALFAGVVASTVYR